MVGLLPNFWYKNQFPTYLTVIYVFFLGFLGFPCGSAGKESACSMGDLGSSPRLERSPGEGHGNPLQYSCLGDSMDRGAGQAAVYGVAKSWRRLCDFHFHFHAFFWEF